MPFIYDLTPEGGKGSKILMCENHYIKSHKKCEDEGVGHCLKGVRSYLNGP